MEAAMLLFLFASFLILLSCFVFVGWYLVMRRLRKKQVTFRFGEQMDMAQLLDNALSSYMMVEVSRKMREASRGLDMSESE